MNLFFEFPGKQAVDFTVVILSFFCGRYWFVILDVFLHASIEVAPADELATIAIKIKHGAV